MICFAHFSDSLPTATSDVYVLLKQLGLKLDKSISVDIPQDVKKVEKALNKKNV